MKLIVNTSTLSGTGVSQVAVSFLEECKSIGSNEYHVFLSPTIEKEIKKDSFPLNFSFYSISSHPLYGFKGTIQRKRLKILEEEIDPDCVFSVFGPSWWTPKSPHLMGYAYPHYVYADSPFFSNISWIDSLKIALFKKIHRHFLIRNGKYYVSETEDVSERLVHFLGCNSNNSFVATNTYNNYFNSYKPSQELILPQKEKDEFRFLSLCSFAPHKNLLILNKVVPLLNHIFPENKIKFVLTVDDDSYSKKFNEETKGSLINIGRINIQDCPQLYSECDSLFLPTTLECFSANYPEAMKMKLPILTSNLSFATTICGSAAIYFDPYNVEDIVMAIKKVILSSNLREELIHNGNVQLDKFLSAKERAEKYLEICKKIIQINER